MSEENVEEVLDEVDGEEVELDIIEDDDDAIDEVEEVEEDVVDWKERALKAERLIISRKKDVKKPQQKVIKESDATRFERLELRQDGYPAEIVDEIMKLGGIESLKNPIVKKSADILLKRYQARNAGEIKSGSKSATVTKLSLEDMKNMSVEELEKALPKKAE